jgi:hypothetical protein
MSTRKPKPSLRASNEGQARWSVVGNTPAITTSLPYPTDLPEKRLQLVTIGDKPRKTSVQARLWPAEESASQDHAPRSQKSRLH